jgi:hypothetical protein
MMPTLCHQRSSRRAPKPDRRRAFELLASARVEGIAEAVMLANDITIDQMIELVRGGLARVTPQRIRAGGKVMEVATLQITEAGRKALTGH